MNSLAHGGVAADGQHVLADVLARVHLEDPGGASVHGEDHALGIEQHQALAHVLGDGVQLALLVGEGAHLALDLLPLALHAHKQRGQLVVHVVLQRLVQVQFVHRGHDALRHEAGDAQRQERHRREDDHQQRKDAQKHADDGALGAGDAQHVAAVGAHGVVVGDLGKRRGVAVAAAAALGERLLELRAVGVARERFGLRAAVVEHRAVRIDQRHAVVAGEALKEGGFVLRQRQRVQQIARLRAHFSCDALHIVGVERRAGQGGGDEHRRDGREHDAPEDSFGHAISLQIGSPRRAPSRSSRRSGPAWPEGSECARPPCGSRPRSCNPRCG